MYFFIFFEFFVIKYNNFFKLFVIRIFIEGEIVL